MSDHNLWVEIYDTTLRDGAQGEGLAYSVEDKIKIARALDELGVAFIEGGWPGANPKDVEFFERVKTLELKTAKFAAFGSTRRANGVAADDAVIQGLLGAETPIVTIFGKSWDFHVEIALKTTLEENLLMIADSVSHLKSKGRRVFYDAEHFFDGFKANSEYALDTLNAAAKAGAETIILCDTNGGTLPEKVAEVVELVRNRFPKVKIGIHAHNDSELAVANSIIAVEAGATQVQGTINGIGERCGNANLCSIIPNLELKMNRRCLPEGKLALLTHTSRYINEVANLVPNERAPFVGRSAFAHKGGIHVSAVTKAKATYEHVKPEDVGNETRVLVSDQSGVSNINFKLKDFGDEFAKNPEAARRLLAELKELEHQGYSFEDADGSFQLRAWDAIGKRKQFFEPVEYRLWIGSVGDTEAVVRVRVNDQEEHTVCSGDGPVHALDQALRKALRTHFPVIDRFHLIDFKVRILDGEHATAAKTRVHIETTNGERSWNTVGVAENIIAASWQAILESIEYGLQVSQHRSDSSNE
ncbi:MAG TPA: citramalate synthase [Blastocatellia bacterium]|nr:citramalate synthase [Blastocatellia bacterium]